MWDIFIWPILKEQLETAFKGFLLCWPLVVAPVLIWMIVELILKKRGDL